MIFELLDGLIIFSFSSSCIQKVKLDYFISYCVSFFPLLLKSEVMSFDYYYTFLFFLQQQKND